MPENTDSAASMSADNPSSQRLQRTLAYAIAALVPIVATVVYYQGLRSADVAVGFPLDDSWIHAQYARTLIEGHPFEYTPGQKSIGTTAVLFDFVWAAATAITGEYVWTIHVVNTLLTVGVGVLLVALLLRYKLPPLAAGAGAALVVGSHPFPFSNLSGMETSLASLVTVAAILAHIAWGWRKGWRPLTAPVLMGLAVMCRPENLVLFPLSELDRLILWARTPRDDRRPRPVPRFALRAVAFGLTLLPYFALNYSIHGAPVPSTYEAKVGRLSGPDSVEVSAGGDLFLHLHKTWEVVYDALYFVGEEDNLILMVLAFFSVVMMFTARWRAGGLPRSFFPLLVFFGGSAATGLVTLGLFFPGQYQRYLIQWIPAFLIFGVIGMHLASQMIGERVFGNARSAYAAVFSILLAANVGLLGWLHFHRSEDFLDGGHVQQYVKCVKNINEMQVELGHWVNENTPEDAIIATNDIGAIRFFGQRPIVDTIGLIDPEMVKRRGAEDRAEAMIEYIREQGASYALLFPGPGWHWDLILDERFQPIHRVVLEDNLICGDNRMIVMQLNWTGNKPYNPPPWLEEEMENCRMWATAMGLEGIR